MRSKQGERVNVNEIALEIDSPVAFTAKILQKLVKSNVIQSKKGPHGGFEIPNTDLCEIMLSDIVYSIDGDSIIRECALGLVQCNEKKPCPLHDQFKAIRNNLQIMLESTNLAELANPIEDRSGFLKI